MASENGSTNGTLDPVIHESSRLLIVSVLNEGQRMDFGFLVSTTGLTKGNLSTEFVDRKPRTSYCLTAAGRRAFHRYRKMWHKLTGGRMD